MSDKPFSYLDPIAWTDVDGFEGASKRAHRIANQRIHDSGGERFYVRRNGGQWFVTPAGPQYESVGTIIVYPSAILG